MPVIFPNEAIAALDALLFTAPRPLSAAALSRLTGLALDDVRGLLAGVGGGLQPAGARGKIGTGG